MVKSWHVKNMDEEVVAKIRADAREHGLSIAEYLSALVGAGRSAASGYGEWRVANVNRGVQVKLVKQAKARGMSLGKYLSLLAEEDRGCIAAENKLKKIQEVVEEELL